ncbi:hypothetical protein HYC85_008092 [Camellia sinensis]|uniref:Ethylene-insensitive protein 2 n=1 Tax=Camellia sinensis TaxID=4442 RepID=A0A7J7HT70_CAMSI|nr:hypothetical protein HYC85_008092 [Camellia sinensis]
MDTEILTPNHQPGIGQRLLPAVVPVLLIAIGYVDPGKWAAAVEGGARFGSDLVLLMLVFNFAAILCQYLSARIAVVTGRDLSQICSEEYDKTTCIFLGVLTELSMIALDLTMDNGKAKFLCISMASFILLFYALGIFFSQPEISMSSSVMLTKLSGESAFTLMSLLGANIMPHNFYLHSSIIQQEPGLPNVSKGLLCHDHFIAILSIFSGVFLVNYVLMNAAANLFYSTGLVLLTFQDALSLMDQVWVSMSNSSCCNFLHISQITALTWKLGRQEVLHDFFGMDIPGSGCARAAVFRDPPFPGCLIKICNGHLQDFSVCGVLSPDHVYWHAGLEDYFSATPLKSASSRLDAQVWNWDLKDAVPESYAEGDESDFNETRYGRVESIKKHEPAIAPGKSLEVHSNMSITSTDVNFPVTLLDTDNMPHLTPIEENGSNITYPSPSMFHPKESATTIETVVVSAVCSEGSVDESVDSIALRTESTGLVEKHVNVEEDLQTGKDEEGDNWEPEESFKGVSGSSAFLTSEGPGSYRSLSGKGDECGSGAGSLTRLAGLGRAARRQLAAVLDEFWGQLFDFHGQATQEAKAKKLDVLLGIESKVDAKPVTPLKVDTGVKEFTGYFSAVGGRGSDSPMNSSAYDSPKLLGVQGSMERGPSSSWSGHMQLLEARIAQGKNSDYLNGQLEALAPKSPSLGTSSYRDPHAFASGRKPQNGLSTMAPPGFSKPVVSRNISLRSERPLNDYCSAGPADNLNSAVNEKKFHSLPDIAGLSHPYRNLYLSDRSARWDRPIGYGPSLYPNTLLKAGAPLAFDEFSPSKPHRDPFTLQFSSSSATGSLWSKQPSEQFSVADKTHNIGDTGVGCKQSSLTPETTSVVDLEPKLLQSLRNCIVKLLKLEGSDWLFRQNGGADEDLIDRVAARERFLYEAETKEMNRGVHIGESQYLFDRKPGSVLKNDDTDYAKFLVCSFPNCGEGCVWGVDLITSFGVWCINRVLELSLMESRPELWGKYTYCTKSSSGPCGLICSFGFTCQQCYDILLHPREEAKAMASRSVESRLARNGSEVKQTLYYLGSGESELEGVSGIINVAFSKPRNPVTPCFCLQIPVVYQQRLSPPISNGILPPPATKQGKGKCTTAAMLLDTIKDVEIAISCRKGRSGTAAGDVAFPKGKENLASVLKRYKRRLSNKLGDTHEGGGGSGSLKVLTSATYCS